MQAALTHLDRAVRTRFEPADGRGGVHLVLASAAWVAGCGLFYGSVMGSFGGVGGDRVWQVLYSAVKVPLLLVGTFALCLPSFFVFNTLAGLRRDFPEVLSALLASQASLTLVLCSLSPFTALWYLSSKDYNGAILFNAAAFALASFTTQAALRRRYAGLVARSRKHLLLLRSWLALYAFVGIQLGWVLRPFVGQPDAPVQWFRSNAWGNAYVEVLGHLFKWLSG